MKALVYGVLCLGAIVLLVMSIRRKDRDRYRNIDIVAYAVIAAGCAFLCITCIVEMVTGSPISL